MMSRMMPATTYTAIKAPDVAKIKFITLKNIFALASITIIIYNNIL